MICNQCHNKYCSDRGGHWCLKIQLRAANARAEKAEAERDEARTAADAYASMVTTANEDAATMRAERDAAIDDLHRERARDATRAARRIALARVAPHALAVRAVHLAIGLVLGGRRPESVDARAVVEGAAGMAGR